VIGHGANKMKKNGKNTKVNTQHSQNKPYITCKAGRYSTRETHPIFWARPWALSASKQFQWQVRMLSPWRIWPFYWKGLQRTDTGIVKTYCKSLMHPHFNKRQVWNIFLLTALM